VTAALSERATADIMAALLPETFWEVDDDLCDCVYQRIGMWTNPYLAETLEVRMCCIWKEMYKLFPGLVRVTPAYHNYNTGEWVTEPAEWNGEFDMPPALWYRQIARRTGRSVIDVREEYRFRDGERPRGIPRPQEPAEETVDVIGVLFDMINGLAQEIAALKEPA